jgi:hypothetical protein
MKMFSKIMFLIAVAAVGVALTVVLPTKWQKPIVLATIDGKPAVMSDDPVVQAYVANAFATLSRMEKNLRKQPGFTGLKSDDFKEAIGAVPMEIASLKFALWYIENKGWNKDSEYQKRLEASQKKSAETIAKIEACMKSGQTTEDCDPDFIGIYARFGGAALAEMLSLMETGISFTPGIIKKNLQKPGDAKQFYPLFQQNFKRYRFSPEKEKLFKDGDSFKPFEKLAPEALKEVARWADVDAMDKARDDYKALEKQFIKLGDEKELAAWVEKEYAKYTAEQKKA